MFFKKVYSFAFFIFLFAIFLIFKNGITNFNIFMVSLSVNLCVMPAAIAILKMLNPNGQPIRKDGPESHIESKKMTPTGGGLALIKWSILIGLFFCDLRTLAPLYLTLAAFMSLGAYDDYLKISKSNSKGISEKGKFLIQILLSALITSIIFFEFPHVSKIYIPFAGHVFDIGFWFLPLGVFIITASSNAMNLTDGLDGLAITQFMLMIGFFILLLLGFSPASKFLSNSFLNQEILKFLSIMIGSSLAFLWYNTFPAKVFMGDSGSLALGAFIGSLSLIFFMPFMLAIFGALIVSETLSVILQVGYFKYTKQQTGTGKKIFLMAPFHHHFEKKHIHENSITIRMMIFSVAMIIFALQI